MELMRSIVDKKTAFRAVLLIFALVAIMSIFPCRIWTNVLNTYDGGNRQPGSQEVNCDYNISQKFVAQYDRLSSVDIYVDSLEKGHYMYVSIRENYDTSYFNTFVDISDATLPGYVNIPMEFDLEVGKEYSLFVMGCRSKYNVVFTDVPDNSQYVGSAFLNETNEFPGRHLDAKYNYRLPISKKLSLILIAAILAVTALIYALIGIYYNKYREKNSLITVGKVVKVVANPIAAVLFLTLMIMVFPLRIFDMRVADIIFYEIGLLISAAIVFYAINHKAVKLPNGVSFFEGIELADKVRYVFIMFAMAMVIWNSCESMNGLANIFVWLPERRMIIWFAIMILLTFTTSEVLNIPNLIWLVASALAGFRYYGLNKLSPDENEYDLFNLKLKYEIIIAVLGGIVVINVIRILFRYITDKTSREIKISGYGILVALFFIGLILMRKDRLWEPMLATMFLCLYIRLAKWKGREHFTRIVAGGLMMNFAISLGFSLLHRYFSGYVSGRFGFIFHTQTVTAEYMIFMAGAATVLLAAKIVAFPKGLGVKELFKSAWKEMILFGWISAYAIFTVSRTAYLSIFVVVFTVLAVVSTRHKKQFIRILATMIAAVIICFPATFTLQRIVPAMVARPVFYAPDDADQFVRGGASWDNSNFMCIERFVNLFESKILGMEVGEYDYPNDILNYDMKKGEPIYDYYGNPYDGSDEQEDRESRGIEPSSEDNLLAAAGISRAELAMLLEISHVDENSRLDVFSNGRVTIFKIYAKELNLTGHTEQPAFPDGEVILHAHNTYLQIAYDHGAIVGLLYLLFIIGGFVVGVIHYKKNEEKEPLSLLSFAIIVGVAVAGISESVLELSYPMTMPLMLSIAPLLFKNINRE
ncbi:hypothetical protein D6853_13635 [Butyrivibrio sp. X503]|uniref:hypothetical protein n=1 Tax=Butyrivibrio sp. X503 TaxID=2364878 RepID=UPI000EAAC478|nr:hypothetical protein [Butyrivibrio sp. X503]RKM54266.1 hypothetical protein D6853_13635 [Butyrivibrio sp. X503]